MLYKFNGTFQSLVEIKKAYKESAPQVSDFETGTRPIPFKDWMSEHVEEYDLRDAVYEIFDEMDEDEIVELYNSVCDESERIYDSYGICDKFQCEGVLDIVRAFRDADPDDDWFLCSYYDYVTSSCYAADLIDVNSFVSDIIHGYADIDCDEIKRLIDLDNEVALTSVLMSKRKWEDADGTTKTVVFVELEYEDGSDNRIDFDTLDDAFDAFCKYAELLDE